MTATDDDKAGVKGHGARAGTLRHAPSMQADGDAFRLRGYWIWLEDARAQRDPIYDQHLELVGEHPGFHRDVAAARAGGCNASEIEALAVKWQLTVPDISAIVADEELESMGDRVFVEITPMEYVVHVPRPITAARRDAVARWVAEVRHWPKDARDAGAIPKSLPHDWVTPPASKQISASERDFAWYRRWRAGETAEEIYLSLPDDERTQLRGFDAVRNSLRAIDRRMREISLDGLPPKGP